MSIYKDIHIGGLIKIRVAEVNIEDSRICNFFNMNHAEIKDMYLQKSLDSEVLLKWSKLLDYDFFRLYTQHLILFSPLSAQDITKTAVKAPQLPQFRKNIYTTEIIDFILNVIETGEKTKAEVIDYYRIPKTTLYKWIEKYKK